MCGPCVDRTLTRGDPQDVAAARISTTIQTVERPKKPHDRAGANAQKRTPHGQPHGASWGKGKRGHNATARLRFPSRGQEKAPPEGASGAIKCSAWEGDHTRMDNAGR
jgi:hypothetical protein